MKRFNVRVYGLWFHQGAVLVSDEFIKGRQVTKFPGGGLQFGEGTIDCLEREFMEELNLKIRVEAHYYTTDFFVASAFDDSQVISIYYLVSGDGQAVQASGSPHDHGQSEGAQSFRWIPLDSLRDDDLTLIIDRKVAAMLRSRGPAAALNVS